MKKKWHYIIGIAALLVLSVVFISFSESKIIQPIEYNHYVHVEEAGMDCISCHQYVETHESAGLPLLETCAECHEESLGESIEESRLVEMITENKALNWGRIFQMPKHVFFSHRRHVVLGELECAVCHGVMEGLTKPPQKSQNKIDMDFCLDCHEILNVSIDCLDCHR